MTQRTTTRFSWASLVVILSAGCFFPEYTEMENIDHKGGRGNKAGAAGVWERAGQAGLSGTAGAAGHGFADTSGAAGTSGASGPGNGSAGQGCGPQNATGVLCTLPPTDPPKSVCGDGAIDTALSEECDLGTAKNLSDKDAYGVPDACTTSCKRAHFCGDQVIDTQFGGVCDGGDTCGTDCKARTCGNGKVDLDEACDEGDPNSPAATDTARCTSKCTLSSCGDGYVNKQAASPEECDPGVFGGCPALSNANCRRVATA